MKKLLSVLLALLLLFSFGCTQTEAPVDEVSSASETDAVSSASIDWYFSPLFLPQKTDEQVYVIGHKSPDSDTVGSAIAYANLLTQLGYNATPAVAGEIDRETQYALDYFKLPCPELLTDASGKNLVLVDHNDANQMVDGAENANILAIVDHHNLTETKSVNIIPVLINKVGANSTNIFSLFKMVSAQFTPEIAGILLNGIMSDTNNCVYDASTELDKAAAEELAAISGIDRDEYNAGRVSAKVNYDGMSDRDILLSDMKTYEIGKKSIFIGCVNSVGEENHLALMKSLQADMDEFYKENSYDFAYCIIYDYITGRQDIICSGEGAEEIALEAVGDLGDGTLTPNPSISRKGVFVPRLTAVLEK